MARYAAADGYITPAAIFLLSHSLTNNDMTFRKIKWSLRFPLLTPSPADPNRCFSSTPAFHNSPSSGEALEGAVRVAAPFTYVSAETTLLPNSEFLRFPDIFSKIGAPHRGQSANPIPPEPLVVVWLRNGAPMVTHRDTSADTPDIPKGLRAYFSGTISHDQAQDLIFHHTADDQNALKVFTRQYRSQPTPLVFTRQIHPAHVVSHAALAPGFTPQLPLPPQ